MRKRENPYDLDVLAHKPFLTPDETSAYVDLGRSKVYELINRGVIPSVRLGNQLRVPRAALDERLADMATAGAAA